MPCERFHRALKDHACGAGLDGRAAAHLDACPACQTLVEQERTVVAAVDDALRVALDVSASPGFSARTAARARAAHDTRWHTARAAWLSAAAAAIVAFAVWAGAVMQREAAITVPPLVPAADVGATLWRPDVGAAFRRSDVGAAFRRPHGETAPSITPAPNLARELVDQPSGGAPSPGSPRPLRRTSVTHASEAAPRRDAEVRLEVIVPPTQLHAIARLWELAEAGALQDAAVPEGDPLATTPADLAIEPLAVTEIMVPDVEIVTGTAAVLRALDTSKEPL
jgi:hypothetical protein